MGLIDRFRQIVAGEDIRFVKNSPTARCPVYSTPGSAGMDVFSDEDCFIGPLEKRLVKTNISIELPSHLQAQMLPRSGLAIKQGITLLNSPGLIDPDYRGSLGALLWNTSVRDFEVKRGDRIAQIVIMPFVRANLVEAQELSETKRGAGGWGSTGVRYDIPPAGECTYINLTNSPLVANPKVRFEGAPLGDIPLITGGPGEPTITSFDGVPYEQKCKRRRVDGPTPCLCCPGECVG